MSDQTTSGGPVEAIFGLTVLIIIGIVSVNTVYENSPAGLEEQAQYEICRDAIRDDMINPESYYHNQRVDTRFVNKLPNNEGWNVLVFYDAADND